uniref:LisH domain containing protein ARMC9 n=1 Tax=Echinococcus granulosus TaxID=6210 RepID=A0A068WBW4_ECHGR|nr:lisH domain containing protein ARMC9 [Echinococcus granulosus]
MSNFQDEQNLNRVHQLIDEFFDYYSMDKTRNSLAEEWQMVKNERTGFRDDWKDFRNCWNDHFGGDSGETMKVRPLEFYLQLYFITVNWDSDSEVKRKERLQDFREFLDTKGKVLSQISEFLPFFAFPYVENPKLHPVYRELFEPDWNGELKRKLMAFLEPSKDDKRLLPKILSLSSRPKEVPNNQERQLQNRLADAERRVAQSHQRFTKIQNDYQTLLGITTDLVDTLEGALRGDHIEPNVLQQICSRLVASQRAPGGGVGSSGAFGDTLTQAHTYSTNFSYGDTLRQSLSLRLPQESGGYQQEWGTAELDFDKINDALKGPNQTQIWRLLQALRWRLTKTNVELREAYLTEFIGHDLLDLTLWSDDSRRQHHLSVLEHCLCSVSPKVTETTSRLVNALASLSRGRAYLAQNVAVVTLLSQEIFRLEGGHESATRENLIGALQKLSLRRSMQTKMTELGMVEWLVDLLEDTDSLSDYSLEYAVALFMNLCLRTAGKARCVPMADRVLKVLTDLISHENTNILSYVNGALFSLLTRPEIQATAESMDLEGILSCFMREDQQELNRQFEYIIKQMHTSDHNEDGASDDDENDDDDDDDEEDGAQMESDIDRGDDITDNKENALEGSVVGENLLRERFLKKSAAGAVDGKKAGRSGGTSPLSLPPPSSSQPPLPYGGHVRHTENDAVVSNNVGLLRRPSTPSRKRFSGSHIPKPVTTTKQQTSRLSSKTHNRPPQVVEETPTRGRIAMQHTEPQQSNSRKDSISTIESKKKTIENHPEYQKAFNSRPKLLRTPEHKRITSSMDPIDIRGGDRVSRSRPASGRTSMEYNNR